MTSGHHEGVGFGYRTSDRHEIKDAKMLANSSATRKIGAIAVGATLLATTACGGGATAGNENFHFTFASAVAEAHPSGKATTQWMDRVEELTDGRVTFDSVWSGALLSGPELFAGVSDGRADIVHTSVSWNMSELPYTSAATLPFVTHDGEASSRAMNELYETNDSFRSEYEDQGVKLISAQPLDVVLLGGKSSFEESGALDGKQIRATGEWIEALSIVGAEPAGIAYAETYEALQRGVVDGYALNWEGVYDLQLQEVAPVMEDPGVGQVSNMMMLFNDQKWKSLPEDIQEAFDKATVEQVESLSDIYQKISEEQCQAMIDGGAQFNTWSEDAQNEWRDEAAAPIKEAWAKNLPNPDSGKKFLDEYIDLIADKSESSTWKAGISICKSLQKG